MSFGLKLINQVFAYVLLGVIQLVGIFVRCCPKRFDYFFAGAISWLLLVVIQFRTDIVRGNLNLVFSHKKSAGELRRIMRENYRHYMLVVFEGMRGLGWTKSEFVQKTNIVNEKVLRLGEENSGGFILTSHLGSWEMSINLVAARGHKLCVVVKKPISYWAQILLQKLRTRFGVRVIYETGITKDIFKALAEGYWVVFVLDQFMGPPVGVPVSFFGKEAGTAAGLALFALKSKKRILSAHNFRNPSGVLTTEFEEIDPLSTFAAEDSRNEQIYKVTQYFNDIIQAHVEKYPEQWLWIHRRWKEFRGKSKWALGSLSMV